MEELHLETKDVMTKNSSRIKSLATTAIVVMLVIAFLGCTPVEQQPRTDAEKLQILTHKMGVGDYSRPFVVGTAKNISPYTLKYAEVEVEFLDIKEDKLEISKAHTSNLAAGENWDFRITYRDENYVLVTDYRIRLGTIQ